MDDIDALEVIRQAERIVWAGRLAPAGAKRAPAAGRNARLGLRPARITFGRHPARHLHGEHLGHVRREGSSGLGERWVAVLNQARRVGTFGSADAAAAALARACGRAPRKA
jgi:hypothetical protein